MDLKLTPFLQIDNEQKLWEQQLAKVPGWCQTEVKSANHYPRHPNIRWVGVTTPKHLLRFGFFQGFKDLLTRYDWRILEDSCLFGVLAWFGILRCFCSFSPLFLILFHIKQWENEQFFRSLITFDSTTWRCLHKTHDPKKKWWKGDINSSLTFKA